MKIKKIDLNQEASEFMFVSVYVSENPANQAENSI
jgi:hypothetical protein